MTEAALVVARCVHDSRGFAMKFEQGPGGRTWTFAGSLVLDERRAGRGGFGSSSVTGEMVFPPGLRICPYCTNDGFIRCGCGKVTCWQQGQAQATCAWCHQTGEVNGHLDSLDGVADV